jgi:CBS domain-containing protein
MKSHALLVNEDFEEQPTLSFDTIGDLLRGPAIAVAPDTPLEDIRKMLVDYRVPAIAVVDDDDAVCGLVTRTDVLRATAEDATARDAMSRFVFSLPASAPIAKAAALIGYEYVGQIVVRDSDGLIGIVSAVDILRYLVTSEA